MGFDMVNENDMVVFDGLSKPGWAHLEVTSGSSHPVDRNGAMITECECELMCSVVNHDSQDQIGKTVRFLFNKPNTSHADRGRFASIILCRLAQALNLMPVPRPPAGSQVSIVWENAKGGQLCVFLINDRWEDAQKQWHDKIKIEGSKIWGVLDPDLPKACPVSQPHRNKMVAQAQQQAQVQQYQQYQQPPMQQPAQQPPQQQYQQPPQQIPPQGYQQPPVQQPPQQQPPQQQSVFGSL